VTRQHYRVKAFTRGGDVASKSTESWGAVQRAVVDAQPNVSEFTEAQKDALWHRVEATPLPLKATRGGWRVVVAGLAAVCVLGGAGVATAAV